MKLVEVYYFEIVAGVVEVEISEVKEGFDRRVLMNLKNYSSRHRWYQHVVEIYLLNSVAVVEGLEVEEVDGLVVTALVVVVEKTFDLEMLSQSALAAEAAEEIVD